MHRALGLLLFAWAWVAFAPPAEAHKPLTRELLADCNESMTKCNEDFILGDLIATLMMNACGPEDPLVAEQEVIEWLMHHPEEHDKDVDTAIEDAKHALFNCMDQ